MNDTSNESIDAQLRKAFEGPVLDGGFSDRVMRALPSRRAPRRWLVPAYVVAGAGACWFALASTSLVQGAGHDWAGGRLSSPVLALLAAMVGMALLAAWWAMAEAADSR